MDSEMLRTGQALKQLGIHRVTLYRWIRAGRIPAVRLPSGEFRINQADIDLLLEHGRLTARAPRARKL